MVDKTKLEQILNIKITDDQLFEMSLTHRSYINENRRKQGLEHNERLEFLGDAVLELVVTEYLYLNYSQAEGILTNWRSALVKTETLSAVASNLKLEDFIRLSRGEAKGSKRAKHQIMANTLEAVIGAIYLDSGYEVAKQFITKQIITQLPGIISSGAWQDAKTKLQEIAQEVEGFTPTYKVLDESGPDHDKRFVVGAVIGNDIKGKGKGSSKQAAQQAAAAAALLSYQKRTKNS